MKVLLQRVSRASVRVDGKTVGSIARGLLVFLGVENGDRAEDAAWNAEKLQTPLLIHTTTNDEDVNVLEVEHLVQALKAADAARLAKGPPRPGPATRICSRRGARNRSCGAATKTAPHRAISCQLCRIRSVVRE